MQTNDAKIVPKNTEISMDGCFTGMITDQLNLNRVALDNIKKRLKPIYPSKRKIKEEVNDFKEFFKMKKDL